MVDLANERHPTVAADAAALPFCDAAFSSVITVHALMEIEALQAAVHEVARVLQPSGVVVAVIEHPFASATKVAQYSGEAPYRWDVAHKGVDIRLGGIHRSLGAYVASFEQAGLKLDTLREISVGQWDPMSLAIRARARSG